MTEATVKPQVVLFDETVTVWLTTNGSFPQPISQDDYNNAPEMPEISQSDEPGSEIINLNLRIAERCSDGGKVLCIVVSRPDDVDFLYHNSFNSKSCEYPTNAWKMSVDLDNFSTTLLEIISMARESESLRNPRSLMRLRCFLSIDRHDCVFQFYHQNSLFCVNFAIPLVQAGPEQMFSHAKTLLNILNQKIGEQAKTIATHEKDSELGKEKIKFLEERSTEFKGILQESNLKLLELTHNVYEKREFIKKLQLSLDTERAKYSGFRETLKKNSETDKETIKILEEKLEKSEEILRTLTAEKRRFEDALDGSNSRLESVHEEKDELIEELDRTREDLNVLRAEKMEWEDKVCDNKLKELNLKLTDQEEKNYELEQQLTKLNREKYHIEQFLEKSDRRLELVQGERDRLSEYTDILESDLSAWRDEEKDLNDELELVHFELTTEKSQHEETRSKLQKAWNLLNKCMDNEPKKTSISQKSTFGLQNSGNVDQLLKQFDETIGHSKENRRSAESWINELEVERRDLRRNQKAIDVDSMEQLMLNEALRQRTLEQLDQNDHRIPSASNHRRPDRSIEEASYAVTQTPLATARPESTQLPKATGFSRVSQVNSSSVPLNGQESHNTSTC